jgi:hypothetical protein
MTAIPTAIAAANVTTRNAGDTLGPISSIEDPERRSGSSRPRRFRRYRGGTLRRGTPASYGSFSAEGASDPAFGSGLAAGCA